MLAASGASPSTCCSALCLDEFCLDEFNLRREIFCASESPSAPPSRRLLRTEALRIGSGIGEGSTRSLLPIRPDCAVSSAAGSGVAGSEEELSASPNAPQPASLPCCPSPLWSLPPREQSRSGVCFGERVELQTVIIRATALALAREYVLSNGFAVKVASDLC